MTHMPSVMGRFQSPSHLSAFSMAGRKRREIVAPKGHVVFTRDYADGDYLKEDLIYATKERMPITEHYGTPGVTGGVGRLFCLYLDGSRNYKSA